MKKVSFLTILLLFISISSSFAQLKFGIRAGVNDNVSLNKTSNGNAEIEYSSGDIGFHFGLTSQLEVLGFFIQPELLFSTNTNDVKYKEFNGSQFIEEVGKQTFNKLDVPILVGFKASVFKFGLGPVFTTTLNSKSDLFDKNDITYHYNNATLGFLVSAGVEWKKFGAELRYEGSGKKYGEGITVGNKKWNFDDRKGQVIGSLAYYF